MNLQKDPVLKVGIGCSAGGVEALKQIMSKLPTRGVCYIVVQHLSPNHESVMAEILDGLTQMPVMTIKDDQELEEGNLYLTPPGYRVRIYEGRFALAKFDSSVDRAPLSTIDVFLESLGEYFGELSAALIMSGSGSDGMLGSRAIKASGGCVIAQDPASAKFASMPQSVVENGLADIVLDLENVGTGILDLIDMTRDRLEFIGVVESDGSTFSRVIAKISANSGIDFSRYKPATLRRRIAKRMSLVKVKSLKEYLSLLSVNPEEIRTIADEFFIGVTAFFRDPDHFEALSEKVIQKLASSNNLDGKLRVWVPACSTGEEAYSIAMLLDQALKGRKSGVDLRIFGTDIDERAIRKAKEGIYSSATVAEIPKDFRERYFIPTTNGNFKVVKDLRESMAFSKHDLLSDAPFGNMHLISFRNCSIYMEKDAQHEVLTVLEHSLQKGGYLFLGSSEALPVSSDLEVLSKSAKILTKKNHGTSRKIFEVVKQRSSKLKESRELNPVGPQLLGSVKNGSDLDKALLETLAPPTIVVSLDGSILQTAGDIEPFASLKGGVFTNSVFDFLNREFKTPVMLAIKKLSESKSTDAPGNMTTLIQDGATGIVSCRIKVHKVDVKRVGEVFVIVFEAVEAKLKKEIGASMDRVDLQEMRDELASSKKDLNFTVENLEITNEELQSSNEELVTSNEELQSVNEELQSVNEELYTMNSEYQSKIEEINQSKKDMESLLNVSKVGTLFLDEDLKIRKISERCQKVMDLRVGDVGRRISSFSEILYPDFVKDCREVSDTGVPAERQVRSDADGWILVKIYPQEAVDGESCGLVVLVVNISELKAMRESQDLLFRFLLSEREVSFGVDRDGIIDFWPQSAIDFFKLSESEALGKSETILLPLKAQADLAVVRGGASEGSPVYISETYRLDADDSEVVVTLIANGRYSTRGRLEGIRYTMFRPGSKGAGEDRVRKEMQTLRTLLETNPMPLVVLDTEGRIEFVNDFACLVFKLPKEEIYSRKYNSTGWEITDLENNQIADSEIPFSKVIKDKAVVQDMRIIIGCGDGSRVPICVNGAPVFDGQKLSGAIMSFYVLD